MRVIAITGASGGIAQALIAALPENDYVLALGRDQNRLEELYGQRPNTACLALDVTNDQAVTQVVETIYAEHGQLDIFINNAGYGDFSDYHAYDSQQVRDMFEVNTFATMAFSRLVGQKMAERGQGHIINIASMAGLIATSKASVYSASKFAVIGFSNALRLELAASKVYVTTVNPGPISTDFFKIADPSGDYLKSVEKFTLTPEEVARKILAILGKNKRELNLPLSLRLTHKFYTLFPVVSDYLSRTVFNYK